MARPKNYELISIFKALNNYDVLMKRYRELSSFVAVGVASTLGDFLTYFALTSLGQSRGSSKALAFLAGAMIGYLGNSRVTFRDSESNIAKYIFIYLMSLFVNIWINKQAALISGNLLFGWICATICSTIINFLGLRYFAFARKV